MSDANEMEVMAGRAGQLIGAITDAIMGTVEAAAERIELASTVARIQTRMAAFSAVLDTIHAQKIALAAKLDTATGTMKTLLGQQLKMLEAQELAVLAKVGVPTEVATLALSPAAKEEPKDEADPVYKRDGRKFVRVPLAPSTNGTHSAD